MPTHETMLDIVTQEWIEQVYSRKHIDAKIRAEIEASPLMLSKVDQGVSLVQEFLSKDYYESKNERLAQLKDFDLKAMVFDLYVGLAYSLKPELLTSVTAKLSARLGLSDRVAAITTVAELLAVLCVTDAFDITKDDRQASLMVVSRIPLSEQLVEYIAHSEYLPPMLCEPLELKHNFSSGYLTHNDSLVLGKGNHHDGDLCLDVLNTLNKVAFKLDTDFLSRVEEEPSEITPEKIKDKSLKKGKWMSDAMAMERAQLAMENWDDFKAQSYNFYHLLATRGNRFYFTNKVDKRGRIYSQGYHLSPQGASFKKAMLELANEEIVTGVPA